ncbi:ABC transporter permease [Actinobacteria bacterium YIM 96077]|uniref:Transport permease protein n=1 Tax=Phytoactinopolyspora halophila TaxID=1981511 RepID=A0A329QQZ5_9ACTN|nr:ABC transporter permease [Phytoactinopolyspora halophila]AYY14232.1 ABC transporter permease [Actinobacteria bacterium YIM 96077]RAW14774.1 ABC transporter permease [Phytoactinopolyspora halophila]
MSVTTDHPHTDPHRTAPPSALRVGLARTVVELKLFFREKGAVVFSFLLPIALLGIFAMVFSNGELYEEAASVDFVQYITPGLLAGGIMLVSFQTLAIGIAMERDDGTLKRLRGTPMPPLAYFLGKIGMVLVAALAQAALLLAAAALFFGVDLPTGPERWLTFAWVFALGTTAGTTLGIGYSSVPKSAKSAEAMVVGPLLVLLFLSGVFLVFTELPEWVQTIASIFPVKWMAQGMRSAFLPDEFEPMEAAGSWQHGPIALILVAWIVAGLILAVQTFHWQRRDA